MFRLEILIEESIDLFPLLPTAVSLSDILFSRSISPSLILPYISLCPF
jgi:hypothetical protein